MLPAGALTSPSLPSMPSRRSRKSLCLCTARSAVSAALSLPRCGTSTPSFLPTPTPRNFKRWAPPLLWGIGPQPKWGSTSPHTPSPFLLPFLCLPAFLCCLPGPQWVSLPVGGGEQGNESNGADEGSSSGTKGSRLLDGGPVEAFGVAAQFITTHASVPPSVTILGTGIVQCPCTQPQALSLSVPPCLAIALSPTWVSETIPTPGTVSSPAWFVMFKPRQCPSATVPSCSQGSVPNPVCPLGRCWFLPTSCLHLFCLCPFLCRQLELFWLGRTAE